MKQTLLRSVFSDDPEILALMEARAKKREIVYVPVPGDKGDSYVLTEQDKKDIAAQIEVPVAERVVVEKHTETIREIPQVVKETIREVPQITEVTKVVKETVTQDLPLTEATARELVKLMRKLPEQDRLEIQDIRNASSFIFQGTRYKTEELMHGAGLSTGGGGTVYYVPTGTVDASNAVFGVTAQPTSVVSDGIVYFPGFGYSYAALVITMDIPPSQFIKYTL